jgi:glycosyltransferase involved in cell wall biosynthesis
VKVCMIAYAQYSYDARIKGYVKSIEEAGGTVDLLVLSENNQNNCEQSKSSRIFYLTKKYQGGNKLLYIWSYLAFMLASCIKISLLSLNERYDAVHVHNMPNIIVFAAIVPKLQGANIFLDIHDLMMTNYMAKFGSDTKDIPVKMLIMEQKISASFASHVLCADHMQKEYLQNVCKIAESKLTVIMNLPDEKTFKRLPKNDSNEKFRLIYHGTIAKRLGIDLMLEAMAKMVGKIPVHLSIYGAGDFLEEALRLAGTLRLDDDSVYFSKSFFPTEMVPHIVRNMDLGIIGNRKTLATDRFMMPVKLLEYVYLGIPVVAPRLNIIKMYFNEGMIKYYEPENVDELARCIVELYRSPHERNNLVQQASKFYEEHGWKIQSEKYLDLLTMKKAENNV